jgi:hypothetical protein
MVELEAALLVGLLSFGVGVVVTLVLGLLICVYLNTRQKDDDDDDGGYVMPLSALMGGGQPGGMGGITPADIQRAAAAVAASKDKAPDAPKGGNYI